MGKYLKKEQAISAKIFLQIFGGCNLLFFALQLYSETEGSNWRSIIFQMKGNVHILATFSDVRD